MRLHEYEGKRLFRKAGIPVPQGRIARSKEEAIRIAREIGRPVVVKAQVLAGSRGKAGGIQIAETPQEAGLLAAGILQKEIHGERAEEVLVEERLSVFQELYVGITVNGAIGAPLIMVSREGGVDVEATAAKHPERIPSQAVDVFQGLSSPEARKLAEGLGLQGDLAVKVADIFFRLSGLFAGHDALLAEINPLIITPEEEVFAADAVMEIDDAALFRHPELQEVSLARITDPLAREGRQIGVSYVGLEGDIGVISSGAGLGMATIDLIAQRGRAANFLETGGGITEKLMAQAMELVLKKPGLRGMLINLYGGINPIHEGARGIAEVMRRQGLKIPVVAKALGNFQEETWKTLEEAGVTVVKTISTQEAVEELFRRVKV